MNDHKLELYLHEEVLLLALRNEEGTAPFGSNYAFSLAAAVIAELMLNRRIRIADKKRSLIEMTDALPVGDSILDDCLERIVKARRRARIETWVNRFVALRLTDRVARSLCRKGVLKANEDRILWIFKRRIYPELNPEPERNLIERLRSAIFTDQKDISPRTAALLSLARPTGLLEMAFDRNDLKKRQDRLAKVCNGLVLGQATSESIEAAQQAAMIAASVAASTVAITTATT